MESTDTLARGGGFVEAGGVVRSVIVWVPGWGTSELVTGISGDRPVAVSRHGKIQYLNAEAKRAGVKELMSRALALHLCADLTIIEQDCEHSQRSFEQILQALNQVSARVYAISPGIAWIPLRGLERHYRDETQLCEELTDAVATSTGCECVVAAGKSLLHAWVEALIDTGISPLNLGVNEGPVSSVGATPGTQAATEVTAVDSGQAGSLQPREREIGHCQLAVLIALCASNYNEMEQVITRLAQFGIYTIRQAHQFGLGQLAGRFGKAGAALAQLLAGENPFPPVAPLPLTKISATANFTPAAEQIDHVVGQLLTICTEIMQQCLDQQVCPRALEITATFEFCRNAVEMTSQRKRMWALTDLPGVHDLLQRVRWQLQAWLEQNQRSQNRFADTVKPQGASRILPPVKAAILASDHVPTGEDEFRDGALKNLTLQAGDLISLQDASEALWGKTAVGDVRAQNCLYRLQALLGHTQVETIEVSPGFDPISRVQRRPWGSVPLTQPWRHWQIPTQWQSDAHYAAEQRWPGAITGLSPPTVFQENIAVQLRDEKNQPVKPDPALLLHSWPHTLTIPLQLADTLTPKSLTQLEKIGLTPGAITNVSDIYQTWPITGRWWHTPPEPARLWVALAVSSSPPLLLDRENHQWFLRAVWY